MRFISYQRKENIEKAVEKTRQSWVKQLALILKRPHIDTDLWDQLEEFLVRADVGIRPSQKILGRLREQLIKDNTGRAETISVMLKQEMIDTLTLKQTTCKHQEDVKPHILLLVGINGVGKTTSIAKLAHLYGKEGKKVLLSAADTFRAGAIEQLKVWGRHLQLDVIAHQPGADPSAVAFDSVTAAKSRNVDVLIVDTAGRIHSNTNLMDEVKKIQRVLSLQQDGHPPCTILTIDATTGQNGLAQAHSFVDALKCHGVFLTKLDGTAKGAIVVSIADELKLPTIYIGTGEQPQDIATFNAANFVEALFQSGRSH